ncbi:MAG TPA: ChaN family lipoprotein [Polyangia bacterium]|nr:ChaN family lipoprotein [Polyangia bacterium]
MRRLLLLILLAGACAHSRPGASATPSASENASATETDERRHGAKGAEEPIPLPHVVVDSSTGNPLDELELADRLRAARAIYVGEEHPNPHHHAVELEVLERAYAADPSLALGLEMLPRTMQAPLDNFVSGALDEDAFLAAVDWKKTWGYPWGFYRPLLVFCREHRLRAWALNAPRSLAHAVAQRGLDGLTPDEKRALPELVPGPEAHREFVREAFGAHPHGKFSGDQFERFYAAQLVWDETMADGVASALAAPDAPRRMVVVAGEGHVRRFAVPQRAARRGVAPFVTILPALDEDRADALKERAADLLWVLATH